MMKYVWTGYSSIRIWRKENNKNDISVHWPPWKNIPRMHFWRKALNQAKVAFFEWTLQKIIWQFHKWSHTHIVEPILDSWIYIYIYIDDRYTTALNQSCKCHATICLGFTEENMIWIKALIEYPFTTHVI